VGSWAPEPYSWKRLEIDCWYRGLEQGRCDIVSIGILHGPLPCRGVVSGIYVHAERGSEIELCTYLLKEGSKLPMHMCASKTYIKHRFSMATLSRFVVSLETLELQEM